MEIFHPVKGRKGNTRAGFAHELYDPEGAFRAPYQKILPMLESLRPTEVRNLQERIDATFREMGVSFHTGSEEKDWVCDMLPHVFTHGEWETIDQGFRQRLRAFEMFLQDVYGAKEILRSGTIPPQVVLASPHYQRPAIDLQRPKAAYLHLSGLCLIRDCSGALLVKHHHFAHASGLSYMMQNRRALARVLPELFNGVPLQALADAPLALLETLRTFGDASDKALSVVLLSPGPGSPVYSEHSFLARRMGIPVVQGGDLLVLNDQVYLKTVEGLERVEVIYNRLADQWLDPLVFRSDSLLGVPGLVHCLRKGTVALINAVGSQLADDRSLLAYANRIIRFYVNEEPILPTLPTFWLGDIDQREMVLADLEAYHIRELFVDGLSGAQISQKPDGELMRRQGHRFVAQPLGTETPTACLGSGLGKDRRQEHVLFALRQGTHFEVFPGALTRVAPVGKTDFEGEWSSRDTWVLGSGSHLLAPRNTPPTGPVRMERKVTSRAAEAFYWMGRYLERASHQAYLIQVIETLETEELNTAERKLYRPMWNRLLPPLETSAHGNKRSINNRIDRYRLLLSPEPDSVVSIFERTFQNATSVLECLSPEAWGILNELHLRFRRLKFKKNISEDDAAPVTRRIAELLTRLVPQFFATATNTMLADDGWRFCELGQTLERAVITAHSIVSISRPLTHQAHTTEIELSAFLRLLGTRDAYRRVYQTRAEAVAVLEFLWQNPHAPRSVFRCLRRCAELLRESVPEHYPAIQKPLHTIKTLCQQIQRVDWSVFLGLFHEDKPSADVLASSGQLEPLLNSLMEQLLEIHLLISDSFLSHQENITRATQPLLQI